MLLFDSVFASFKHFASSHPLTELMTAEESEAAVLGKAAVSVTSEDYEETTTVTKTDGVAEAEKSAVTTMEPAVDITGAEELEKYVGMRETFYKASKEWDESTRDFENAIRRPYFHVRPLDDAQLANWHKYLDFVEKEGVIEKVNSGEI
jgi:pre-mRNA-processing factor 39